MYLLYDTRTEKPVSIHKSLREAKRERKKYYGYSNTVIHEIVLGDVIVI